MLKKFVIGLFKLLLVVLISLSVVIVMTDVGFASEHIEFVLCNPETMVNVRYSPSTGSEAIGYLECGQAVVVDGKYHGRWAHVIDLSMNDAEGWVFEGYLTQSEVDVSTRVCFTTTKNVRVRKDVNGQVVKRLRKKTEVIVYARSGQWAVTNVGYIQVKYLEES